MGTKRASKQRKRRPKLPPPRRRRGSIDLTEPNPYPPPYSLNHGHGFRLSPSSLTSTQCKMQSNGAYPQNPINPQARLSTDPNIRRRDPTDEKKSYIPRAKHITRKRRSPQLPIAPSLLFQETFPPNVRLVAVFNFTEVPPPPKLYAIHRNERKDIPGPGRH